MGHVIGSQELQLNFCFFSLYMSRSTIKPNKMTCAPSLHCLHEELLGP